MDFDRYLSLIENDFKEKFDILKNELQEGNKKFNLTAICDDEGIKVKHFLDSVAGESFFKENANVVEIGSGGGFPSLPLKIIRGDLHFTLVESTGKKCVYLQSVVDKLALTNVKVLNVRAEDAARQVINREMYDVACARAVARLNTLCEYCLPFVKVGGSFIAYKGDCEEELEEAKRAIEVLGGEISAVERYTLQGDKRTLVVIKKVKSTPAKYPRGQGKERKNPIV
ncbi:MAG: 16S rRNA (guanine(527)-N(7))-methyltransferase RsmG [Clostridia bacterium]|nr:16S rRNA (guanine(527)-N(7))-methyltransferase RsmG [Clostridia bacterium]